MTKLINLVENLLKELKVDVWGPYTIFYDNQGVVLAANPVLHNRSKHFILDLLFV